MRPAGHFQAHTSVNAEHLLSAELQQAINGCSVR